MRTNHGQEVDEKMDSRLGELFDDLLDSAAALRNPMHDQSLGKTMEGLLPNLDPLQTGLILPQSLFSLLFFLPFDFIVCLFYLLNMIRYSRLVLCKFRICMCDRFEKSLVDSLGSR